MVSEDYEDSIEFVGVAGRDDESAMQGFIDEHGLSGFPHVADESGDIWERFGIFDQPAWVFADAGGNFEVVFGAIGETELRERLDALADS